MNETPKITIELRVDEILQAKGKSNYWLSQQLGMCYRNYHNLVANEAKGVHYSTLARLCQILEVPIGELFREVPNPLYNDKEI